MYREIGAFESEFGVNISYHHYCKMSMERNTGQFWIHTRARTHKQRPQMPNQINRERKLRWNMNPWSEILILFWNRSFWFGFLRFQFHCICFIVVVVLLIVLHQKSSPQRLNYPHLCAWCETSSNWTGNIVFALPLPNRTYQRNYELRLRSAFSLFRTSNGLLCLQCLHIEDF